MNTWELAAIGTVLRDAATYDGAADLKAHDFTRSNRLVWSEIEALARRGELDYRSVLEGLRNKGLLDEIGTDITDISGEEYLQYTMGFAGPTIGEFARQVIEGSVKRDLREVAALISLDAATDTEADELLDQAERRIFALRRARGAGGVPMSEIIDAFIPRMEGMRDGSITPALVPTIQAVRDIIGYYDHSEYIIVAGRPGEGKSSLIRHEAQRWAEDGKRILVFNLENSEIEYGRYSLALKTGIDSQKLKNPRLLSNREVERVRIAAEELKQLPIEVITLGAPSVYEIARIARSKKRSFNQDVVMVDYVQLINNGIDNRVQDVTMSSQILRSLAMKDQLNIPVICAAQLSRAIVQRGGEPQLSDLRESGSLEQDATIVMFIRPVWQTATPSREQVARFPENMDERNIRRSVIRAAPVRIHVLKNRNGPVGVTGEVKWLKHTGGFQSLVREVT
jgi:replicative DNA helicase